MKNKPLSKGAGLKNFGKKFGVIAQMGERYNGIVEVTGSIPVGSIRESSCLCSDHAAKTSRLLAT